jgi:hypothetical protein
MGHNRAWNNRTTSVASSGNRQQFMCQAHLARKMGERASCVPLEWEKAEHITRAAGPKPPSARWSGNSGAHPLVTECTSLARP